VYEGHAAFRTPADEAEALAEQDRLRAAVVPHGPLPRPLRYVAGLDVAYATDESRVAGAVAVLDVRTLEVVDSATARRPVEFPYVPGLLAFREIPALLDALEQLTVVPDVLVCDGYGLAHPRRFGLACHLGVLTGIPTFGVAKTPFVGRFTEPGRDRGAVSNLVADGPGTAAAGDEAGSGEVRSGGSDQAEAGDSEIIGRVLRTQAGIKPVFISVGHRIGLDEATGLTLRLAPSSPGFRLPETTRRSDQLSRQALAEG
jgi:deoxyribonuclease V